MEFLMTYGWALVVVLVAIGALAFFGVLNPSKFLPETCVLGPGFACASFKVVEPDATYGVPSDRSGGNIFINVQNGLGENLDHFSIHVNKENPLSSGEEMCGGYTGFITLRRLFPPPEFVVDFPPFLDGEVRPLWHLQPANVGLEEGISCENNHPQSPFNCCGTLTAVYKNPPVNVLFCEETTDCSGSPEIAEPGEKFSEDIIITYSTVSSNIVHSRVGKLSAQIEEA